MASSTQTRQQGRVKKWFAGKGFGFIAREGERDLFVHVSALSSDLRRLADGGQLEGTEVTFTVTKTPKGLAAEGVEEERPLSEMEKLLQSFPVPPEAREVTRSRGYLRVVFDDGAVEVFLPREGGEAEVRVDLREWTISEALNGFASRLKRAIRECEESERALRKAERARLLAAFPPRKSEFRSDYQRPSVSEDGSDFGSRAWRNRD